MRVTVFDHSFIRHWALRGESYGDIAKRLRRYGGTLTPHDVLMILLEMSNEPPHMQDMRRARTGAKEDHTPGG